MQNTINGKKRDDDTGMTRQDAGRLGGKKTKERYGSEHFSQIGRQGGKARGVHR